MEAGTPVPPAVPALATPVATNAAYAAEQPQETQQTTDWLGIVAVLALAGILIAWIPSGTHVVFGGSLVVDDFARVMKILALVGSAAHPTTIDSDVLHGLDTAVAAAGGTGCPRYVCSSAGGGLRLAVVGQERMLFFVMTRGSPADEDEWWSCGLDSEPESVVAGLRWHCRDSYVPAPPSRDASGQAARWLRSPQEHPLPDALRLLEYLVDACEA